MQRRLRRSARSSNATAAAAAATADDDEGNEGWLIDSVNVALQDFDKNGDGRIGLSEYKEKLAAYKYELSLVL